jgi:oxygen-independent coproporphyrinogen-3 oxidase
LAGIYVHIPFCKQACHYCNFHFTTSLTRKNELIAALLKEADLQQNYLQNELVETVYFGGGTPSLLGFDDLKSLTGRLGNQFSISPSAEITLEANPDDISEEKIEEWIRAGINRLSIGIQSFFDEDLAWMNRAHTAIQATRSLELAVKNFTNITMDLIYGTSQLTDEKWKSNVESMLAFDIPHVSCYALTVEPKTSLHKMIKLGKSGDINPDRQSHQFLLLMQWLNNAGYEHYEISNFAKPGFQSRHNSSYWQGKKYLGIGPSAHSFNGISRQWNVSNNNTYITSLKKNKVPFEMELLNIHQQMNEYIMTSLRTMEGVQLDYFESKFGKQEKERLLRSAQKYIETGRMLFSVTGSLLLTNEGKLFADGIASDLFVLNKDPGES